MLSGMHLKGTNRPNGNTTSDEFNDFTDSIVLKLRTRNENS